MFTFLTPQGTTYRASAPQSPQDIGVPDRPPTLSASATFDREKWEWVESLMAKVQAIMADYADDLDIIRNTESAARLAGNETEEQDLITEYRALLKERDTKIQEIVTSSREAAK